MLRRLLLVSFTTLVPGLAYAQGPGEPPPVPSGLPAPVPLPAPPSPVPPLGVVPVPPPPLGVRIGLEPPVCAPCGAPMLPGSLKYFDDPVAGRRGYTYLGLDGKVHTVVECYKPCPPPTVVVQRAKPRHPLIRRLFGR